MIRQANKTQSDVTILGGGLAGLTLALHCRKAIPHAPIRVLEKNTHPVPEAAFKVGESTVEVAAHYFGKVLDLEPHILAQQLPKLGLRFFFRAGDNSAIERRLEIGGRRFAPAPSYQLDRGRFENYLAERCLGQQIQLVDDAKIREVNLNSGREGHQIKYEVDGYVHTATSRWVVDASGRASLLKRQLGLQKASPHRANAAWFRVKERIRIDDWSDAPEWQAGYDEKIARWLSTNHLMGEGYWVWIIPLASGSTSIGIVADENIHPLATFNSLEKSLAWLDHFEPQCAEKVREHQDKIQDFLAIKRYATECKKVFSPARWGITGEAGFFLDPFYSPGSDFIAFANTLLVDLIQRDLNGKGYRIRAAIYDRIFKKFYHGTASVYQDQYQLFGNHQVMSIKVLWDYIIYWSITGFVCMHDRVCDQAMYIRHMFKLQKLSNMNHLMQELFRRWHHETPTHEIGGRIDISTIDLIRETNTRLTDNLNGREYSKRFAENVAQVETLFWEIVAHSGVDMDIPFKPRFHDGVRHHSLQHAFEVISGSECVSSPVQIES